MIRNYLKYGVTYGFLPLSFLNNDKLENLTETEKRADISVVHEETGMERLKKMFEVDEFGDISLEAHSILQVATMSVFVGALYGGFMSSRGAFLEFMKNNNATKFTTPLEAKSKLQDKVTISFGIGAFKWGWRITLFSTSFVGISTMIQTYRGKTGFCEYVAAGGISGALYKFNIGPRGWIVGGGVGAALGFIGGGITLGLLKLTGLNMAEVRYWSHQWKHYRQEAYRKGIANYVEKEDYAIIKLHNDKVGKTGEHISNLDREEQSEQKKDTIIES